MDSVLVNFEICFLLILFFVYIIQDKNKTIKEFSKYSAREVKEQKDLLRRQYNLIKRKRPSQSVSAKKEIREKIKGYNKERKRRLSELKRLGKSNEKKKMMQKLSEWKRKGYRTNYMENRLKGLTKSEMNKIMAGWKKEGYRK